jgi:multicomponent Na+:H+ antiporter subunit D
LHRWLVASSGAPFPALVALHALAVVPVGGIGMIKIGLYVFGPELEQAVDAARILLVVAGVGACYAALIAISKNDIRERLAYAAMAQALAIVMGALFMSGTGFFAAALQIAALACGSSTMLMAAGAAYAVTERLQARDLHGIGRVMPWTMAGFAVGAASIIGMPPFAGAWAKLWLITAAADAGAPWAAGLAGLSAVLMFASLAPLAANALVAPAPTDPFKRAEGASIMLVAPIILSAAATLWLLLLASPIADFVSPVLGGGQ